VCDQENSKTRRLKARYRAVENATTKGCNARKTKKKTSKPSKYGAWNDRITNEQ
jgi:hypothetical protein